MSDEDIGFTFVVDWEQVNDKYSIMSEPAECVILQFPTERIANTENVGFRRPNSLPAKKETISLHVDVMSHIEINKIFETSMVLLSNHLENTGLNIFTAENLKDGALFAEAFRSMICKQYHIGHPLQQVAEEIFHYDPEDESLRIVSELNIKL